MTLKKYLKEYKKDDIALLFFNNVDNVISYEFKKDEYNSIPKELLKMTVMDINKEDDCMEIWIK